ncbi:nucleotide-diphospho-sugar transferase [Dactylonectria macrodidyma]|uniref:Nucleotide-diphospho-sugar transferase n=1 Tax=Dactylonectria macrodidyma TaxID=307937 RepID=A0A9P9DNA7_9HYPO|nr:nucleotide-diphospho-sugar transferase [Dactylonectria macrodidyma]
MRFRLRFPRASPLLKSLLFFACLALIYIFARRHGSEGARPEASSPNAYVFYAAQDAYACSVLVNIYLLKTAYQTKHRIVVLLSKDVSAKYRYYIKSLGAEVIREDPMPLHPESSDYYRGCLLKLAAFRMHEIDPTIRRILVLDSDQLILKDLDHLFDLPPTDFAAPRAYWLDKAFLSSTLMLIQPTPKLWSQIQQTVATLPPYQYDMDIVNSLFGDMAARLPSSYVVLNNHWEDWTLPSWFSSAGIASTTTSAPSAPSQTASDKDLQDLLSQSYVLHFTAVGKPWMHDAWAVSELKPYAHPLLHRQWEEWRLIAMDVCPKGLIDHL